MIFAAVCEYFLRLVVSGYLIFVTFLSQDKKYCFSVSGGGYWSAVSLQRLSLIAVCFLEFTSFGGYSFQRFVLAAVCSTAVTGFSGYL